MSWAAFLAGYPDHHLLQTKQWGELKAHYGWKAVRLIEEEWGAQILVKTVLPGLKMAYIPKGPLAPKEALKRWIWGEKSFEEHPFFLKLDHLCKEEGIAFLKIEPDIEDLGEKDMPVPNGFIRSRHAIQPLNTILIDLRGSENVLLQRMKQKTRYNIRLSERKGVQVEATSDFESFYQLMVQTGKRDGFGVHEKSYYQRAYELFHPSQMCELFTAAFEGNTIAALMVFAQGERAWYFYGASSENYRQMMAPYLLQWKAMLWAKGRGCGIYDLWGVPDCGVEELEKRYLTEKTGLWGVYRFKRGFGGKVLRYCGPYDRVYQPLIYSLYQAWQNLWK